MPKIDDETLHQRYQKAKEAWDERQKANRARQRREKAQADARCRTIIGGMVLHHVQDNPHERERLMKSLDAFLDDAKDRALFDLSPKPAAPSSPAPNDQLSPEEPSHP